MIKVVAVSLGTLNQQMSQAYIAKQQLPPMLELEMHLSGDKVSEPPGSAQPKRRRQAVIVRGHLIYIPGFPIYGEISCSGYIGYY